MAETLVLGLLSPILALPFLAVLAGITLVAPSWRWVAGFIVLVWIAFALSWARHWIVTSRPGYDDGPGGGLGIMIFTCLTASVVFGSAAYAAAMLWMHGRTRGRGKSGSRDGPAGL